MAQSTVQPEIPVVATLLVHALLGAGLVLAGSLTSEDEPKKLPRPGQMTNLEEVKLPTPAPTIPTVVTEPEPVTEPPATAVEPAVKPAVTQTRRRSRSREAAPAIDRSLRLGRPELADNPDDNQDQAAPLYRLPNSGAGGSIPVPEGIAPRGPYGSGGKGTNTKSRSGGGDGPPNARGSGGGPISVASIKTRAQPLGEVDYEKIGRDYPAAAKRLGVEGKVKIRLVIDAKGRVTSRRLLVKKGHGLDELALKLANKLRFDAAIDTNDKPVRSVVVWTFNFVLPRA